MVGSLEDAVRSVKEDKSGTRRVSLRALNISSGSSRKRQFKGDNNTYNNASAFPKPGGDGLELRLGFAGENSPHRRGSSWRIVRLKAQQTSIMSRVRSEGRYYGGGNLSRDGVCMQG